MKAGVEKIFTRFWSYFHNRIWVYYLIIGGTWILLSDRALMWFAKSTDQLTHWQTFKGWFYVLISGAIIWFIVRRYEQRLKSKMNELSEALRRAEESDRMKTLFLQNISHEVRTPLNAIMGFAEILENTPEISMEQREFLRHIRSNGEDLRAFLEKVLDVAILDSGSAHVLPRRVILKDLIRESYLEAQYLADLHPHLVFSFDDGGLSTSTQAIETDPDIIQKILINILENAFKFTTIGNIILSVSVEDDHLVFRVQDTGPGITEQEKSYIFDRFRTGESRIDKITRGAGLGLYIARQYTSLLKGDLQVTSHPGTGSEFSLSILLESCT
ncbi:MAG: sensor histidine kinase [Bacteroidales bacterium]